MSVAEQENMIKAINAPTHRSFFWYTDTRQEFEKGREPMVPNSSWEK
jgi:hypothetical protein